MNQPSTATLASNSWDRALRVVLGVSLSALVLALFPYVADPVSEGKHLLAVWAAVVVGLLWTVGSCRTRRPVFPARNLEFWILLVFFILYAIAAISSTNRGHSLIVLTERAAWLVLFFAAAWTIDRPTHYWGIAYAFCATVAGASVYGLMQRLGYDPLPWSASTGILSQAPATFGNPNLASHALILALVLAAGLIRRSGWSRWSAPPTLFILLYLVHFQATRTRGSLLALAVAAFLVFVVVMVRRRGLVGLRGAITSVAFTAIALLLALFGAVLYFWHTTGAPVPADQSTHMRYNSFRSACLMIQDRPLLGFGPGRYEMASPPYWTELEQERFVTIRTISAHVHNEVLEIGVEAGLPAALLYLAFLVTLIIRCLLMSFDDDGERRCFALVMMAFFTAFLVDGLLGFNFDAPVSGAFCLFSAGAVLGVLRRPVPLRTTPCHTIGYIWRSTAIGLLIGAAIFTTRGFVAAIHLENGKVLGAARRTEAAHKTLGKAQQLAPWNYLAWHNDGLTWLLDDQPALAAACFERALHNHPNYVLSMTSLGRALLDKGIGLAETGDIDQANAAWDDALAWLERAIEIAPMMPEAHEAAIRVWSVRAASEARRGNHEAVRARWRDALEQMRRALQADALEGADIYRFSAQAHAALGATSMAFGDLARALQTEPGDASLPQTVYQLAHQTRHIDQGVDLLTQHLRHLEARTDLDRGPYAATHAWLNRLLLFADRDKQAAAFARHGLARCPADARIELLLARALVSHDVPEARRVYERAIEHAQTEDLRRLIEQEYRRLP